MASDRDEAQAQRTIQQMVIALKNAHQLARDARAEISRVQLAQPQPVEMDKYVDILPLAYDTFYHAMGFLEIIVDDIEGRHQEDSDDTP